MAFSESSSSDFPDDFSEKFALVERGLADDVDFQNDIRGVFVEQAISELGDCFQAMGRYFNTPGSTEHMDPVTMGRIGRQFTGYNFHDLEHDNPLEGQPLSVDQPLQYDVRLVSRRIQAWHDWFVEYRRSVADELVDDPETNPFVVVRHVFSYGTRESGEVMYVRRVSDHLEGHDEESDELTQRWMDETIPTNFGRVEGDNLENFVIFLQNVGRVVLKRLEDED